MLLIDEISKRISEFENLCASHNVKSLYTFGSSVTNRFDPDKSDIDLLVEIDVIDPIERGEKLISLWEKFEDFFQRKVDLLTGASIRNPYLRESIETTKVLIYDRSGKKVFI